MINKNIIHLVKKTTFCRYNSMIFPDYFLKFYFGSPAKTFVENIVGNDKLPICRCFPIMRRHDRFLPHHIACKRH